MHPTVLLSALTSVCVCARVCVWGGDGGGGGVAYVRSCAHIHQWNVKRKRRGGVLSPRLVVFCSLSAEL